MTAALQDNLLIRTYTNDLAVVPDIFAPFSFSQNRKRGLDDNPWDILYEQNPIGQQPAKRHCPLPTHVDNNFQLASLGTGSMQKEKLLPNISFMSTSTPTNQLQINQEKVQLLIVEEPEQVSSRHITPANTLQRCTNECVYKTKCSSTVLSCKI